MFGVLPKSGMVPASWPVGHSMVTRFEGRHSLWNCFLRKPWNPCPFPTAYFSHVNSHAGRPVVCRKPLIVVYTIQEYPTQLGIPAIFTVLYPEKEGCLPVLRKAEGHVLLEPGGPCSPLGFWCLSFPMTSSYWWLWIWRSFARLTCSVHLGWVREDAVLWM